MEKPRDGMPTDMLSMFGSPSGDNRRRPADGEQQLYRGRHIRYTTDGTNPKADSPAIEAGQPVDIDIPAGGQIRVRQWVHGQPSVVTVLKALTKKQ